MKDRYTIGEVANLLNMSPQSLRFYDKAGVVVPAYTNPKTGYRYYSYDQIHYIDRVKYLQRFGFTLEDIRDALDTNDVSRFRRLLMQRQEQIRQEVSHLQGLLDELDWYADYYSHAADYDHNGLPYQQRETELYILAEPFRKYPLRAGGTAAHQTAPQPPRLKRRIFCVRPAICWTFRRCCGGASCPPTISFICGNGRRRSIPV